MKFHTKRISEDKSYKRPKQTKMDKLQDIESIKKKLIGYTKVENISDVPLHSHIRYITWKDNKQRFCVGGWLKKIHDDYVVLSSKTISWSVQRKHFSPKNKKLLFETIFFKKQSIIEKYEHTLRQQYLEIQELKKENYKMKKKLQHKKK